MASSHTWASWELRLSVFFTFVSLIPGTGLVHSSLGASWAFKGMRELCVVTRLHHSNGFALFTWAVPASLLLGSLPSFRPSPNLNLLILKLFLVSAAFISFLFFWFFLKLLIIIKNNIFSVLCLFIYCIAFVITWCWNHCLDNPDKKNENPKRVSKVLSYPGEYTLLSSEAYNSAYNLGF